MSMRTAAGDGAQCAYRMGTKPEYFIESRRSLSCGLQETLPKAFTYSLFKHVSMQPVIAVVPPENSNPESSGKVP
jgi:hypothetical protein